MYFLYSEWYNFPKTILQKEGVNMPGLGTVVNTAAIIAGGITGYFAKKLLKERIQKILLLAMALSILVMGINGIVAKSLQISDGNIA